MVVSDALDKLNGELLAECNRHVNGVCHTRSCMIRGGWVPGSPATYDLATCSKREQAAELAALREELHQTRSDRQREHDLRCRLAGEAEALRARVAELVECVKHSTEYRIGHPSFERAVARATESAEMLI